MALEPITREETYLAAAAGQIVETPEPITRKEMFLDAIAKSGGGGGTGGGSGKVVEIANLVISEDVQYVFHSFSFDLYDVVFVKIVQTEKTQVSFSFNNNVSYFIVSPPLYNHADLTIFQIDKERAFAAYNSGYSLPGNNGSNASGDIFKGGMTFDPVKTGLKIYKTSKWKTGDNIRIWGRLKA